MTLRDLLRKTSYHAIFNCIHKEYYYKDPDDEVIEMSLAYRRVINKLLSYDMSPNPEYQILIRGVEGEENQKTASFIDVCLQTAEDEETYAIDLVSWVELVDSEIHNEAKLNNDCAAAHILWEITFYGFTEDSVDKEKKEMEELIKRIDSGEEKLIPWEEIEKEIDTETDSEENNI
jgi:hypothetical protein